MLHLNFDDFLGEIYEASKPVSFRIVLLDLVVCPKFKGFCFHLIRQCHFARSTMAKCGGEAVETTYAPPEKLLFTAIIWIQLFPSVPRNQLSLSLSAS